MRRLLLSLNILFVLLALISCSSSRQAKATREEEMYFAREKSPACFVQFIDGSIQKYYSLTREKGVGLAPHLLANGKIRIFPNQVLAYQNHEHYAISSGGFSIGGHESRIATETLPGFAIRIAKGDLNIYVKKFRNGTRYTDEFYFQLKKGNVIPYSPELMDALIKNMPEALVFYNQYKKQLPKSKDLIATAYIFNHTFLASRK